MGFPLTAEVRVPALSPAPQRSTGVRRGTASALVVVFRSSPAVASPVEVSSPEGALLSTELLCLGWSWLSGPAPVEAECPQRPVPAASSVGISSRSWLSGPAPVEAECPAAARSETIPLAACGAMESSLAGVSVTLAKATGSVPVAEVAGSVPVVAVAGSITDPKVAVSVTVPEAAGSVPTVATAPMLSVGTSRDPEELERSRVCPWIGVLPRVCPLAAEGLFLARMLNLDDASFRSFLR